MLKRVEIVSAKTVHLFLSGYVETQHTFTAQHRAQKWRKEAQKP